MGEVVKFNNGFFDALGRSAGVTSLVLGKAQEVADVAISTAPRDTEDYANGIKVELKHQKRSVALVVGHDKKTMLVESKTGNLVRALIAVKKRNRRG